MHRSVLGFVLSLASCGGAAAPEAEPARAPVADSVTARDECVAVMERTRGCADTYVPALLALRVRLDRPEGIAARFEEEGEAAMVALAREQFAADWSDEAIANNCDTLAARPAEEQERILAPERECMREPDCEAFTACDIANKERRWTAEE
ncbi:MAG: hypothetical protein R3B82_03140 [Sandaracinaceae bacterium]